MSKFFRFYSKDGFSLGNYPMISDDPFPDTICIKENSQSGVIQINECSDAEHCRSIVCICRDVYRRAGWKQTWVDGSKLVIYPHATGVQYPAEYSGIIDNEISFYYETDKVMCRSFDLVAHETGHAIMASMDPFKELTPEPQGIRESFSDLTAIFARLFSQGEITGIIPLAPADLWQVDLLTCFEDTGMVDKEKRKLSPKLMLKDIDENNRYSWGDVLSSTVFGILAELYSLRSANKNYAQVIFESAVKVSDIFFKAIVASLNNLQLQTVKQKMIAQADKNLRLIIDAQFEKHGI